MDDEAMKNIKKRIIRRKKTKSKCDTDDNCDVDESSNKLLPRQTTLIDSSPRRICQETLENQSDPQVKNPEHCITKSSDSLNFSPVRRVSSSSSSNSSPRSILGFDSRANSPSPRKFSTPLQSSPRRLDLSKETISLRKQIGHGGAAKVYEADISGYIVAVKIYHQHYNADDIERKNMEIKLEVMSSLSEHFFGMSPFHQGNGHPNILPIFGYRIINGCRLVVVTEKMDCTLRDIIDERRKNYYAQHILANNNGAQTIDGTHITVAESLKEPPFKLQEVIGILRQIINGLKFLHNLPKKINAGNGTVSSIWHRDLKCENILCSKVGYDMEELLRGYDSSQLDEKKLLSGQYRFKIADIDECRIVYEGAQVQNLSSSPSLQRRKTFFSDRTDLRKSVASLFGASLKASGEKASEKASSEEASESDEPHRSKKDRLSMNVGTLQFMAPEMARIDESTYDEGVDIWSFGMLLYEILTMELPYGRDNYNPFELYDIIQRGVRPSLPSGYLYEAEWSPILKLFTDCTELSPMKRPRANQLEDYLD